MQQFTYQKLQQQKAHVRRSKGIKAPFSLDTPLSAEVKRVRTFNAPTVFGSLKARRGRCVLSHEKRLAILNAVDVKAKARVAFFAELAAASKPSPTI
jgi:hypothetical protein